MSSPIGTWIWDCVAEVSEGAATCKTSLAVAVRRMGRRDVSSCTIAVIFLGVFFGYQDL
jgi:hypothetical protein